MAPNSVVILDNATTHSKQYNKPPVQSSNVKIIKNWLDINNIYYNNSANKQELLKIVKENNYYVQHTVDEIILNAGHIPLRLPPYHCELNPIELVMAQLKKIIAKHNFYYNSIEFKNLISKAFLEMDSNFWLNCIKHVVNIESQFWISDKIIYSDITNEHNYCDNFFND